MSLGFGIFLMAVGAILAFAVNVSPDWIALTTVGYILIAAGALITILGIVLLTRKRQSVSSSSTGVDPVTGARVRRDVREDDVR